MTTKNKPKDPMEEIKSDETLGSSSVETEKEKTKEITESKKRDKKAYIYMGPNIKGGLLSTGKICSDIPPEIKSIIENAPSVEKLFVEVKEVAKFKEQLKNQSTIAYRNYNKAVEELKGV